MGVHMARSERAGGEWTRETVSEGGRGLADILGPSDVMYNGAWSRRKEPVLREGGDLLFGRLTFLCVTLVSGGQVDQVGRRRLQGLSTAS